MAEPPSQKGNDNNPLLSLLGERVPTEVNTGEITNAIESQTRTVEFFLTQELESIGKTFQSLAGNITQSFKDLAKITSSAPKSGKEERQEQRSMFRGLFKDLGKSISDSIDGLKGALKNTFDGSGIMAILKPIILVAAAYLFRTFKVLETSAKIVVGLFKGLPRLFRGLRTFFGGLFNLVKGPIGGLFTKLGGLFSKLLAKSGISKFFSNIVTKLQPAFNAIKTVMTKVKTAVDIIGGAFGKVITKVQPVFKTIGGFFGKIGNFAKGAGGVASKVGGVFGTVGKVLKPVFGVFKPIMGFVGKIGKFFKAVPILGQVITLIEGIVGFFRGFFGTEGSFFDKLISGVQGIFAQIISGLTFGLVSFDDVMGFFDNVTTTLGNFFFLLYDFFTTTVPNFVKSAFNGLISFFTDTIPTFFSNLVTNIISFFTSPVEFIKDRFSIFVSKAKIMFLKIRLYIAELLSYIGMGEDTDELEAQIASEQNKQRQLFARRDERLNQEFDAEGRLIEQGKNAGKKKKVSAKMADIYSKSLVSSADREQISTEAMQQFLQGKSEKEIQALRTGEGSIMALGGKRFGEETIEELKEITRLQREKEEEERQARLQAARDRASAVVVTNNNNIQSFEMSDEPATEKDQYGYANTNMGSLGMA